MLDDLKIFITAADKNSLTQAAKTLNMTIATVSRRISALEQALGCELLHRSTKGLKLTPMGEDYYQECAEFIDALDQRISNLDKTLHSLNGEVKILAPTNLGGGPLDPFWQQFISQYPQISLNIELSNRFQDMRETGADLAIRSGKMPNSSLIQTLLGYIRPILVAAKHTSFPLPNHIDELKQCPSIVSDIFADWQLVDESGEMCAIDKQHQHISNDMNVSINLVKAGAGITLVPESMAYKAIQSGELVQVLPEWQGQKREIHLVWPGRRSVSARAQLLKDELTQFLHQQDWFEKAY